MNFATVKLRTWANAAAIAVALAVQTVISLLAASVPVFAPEISAARGWNVGLIALYPTIVFSTAFAVSFLIPYLLSRLGGMGLLAACVALSAAGVTCLLVPDLVLLISTPVAIGLATGAMNPAGSQVLGPRTTPRTAGLIMSVKQTGVPLGAMAAGVLVPYLVIRGGWVNAVLTIAGAATAVAIACLPLVSWLNGAKTRTPGPYRPLEPVKRLLAIPSMREFLMVVMFAGAMQHCLRAFFIVYLVKDLRFGLAAAGLAFSVSQAAGIVGQIGWAALSDRFMSGYPVMAIIGLLTALGAFLTASMSESWPIYGIAAAAAVYGLSAGGFVPVVLAEVARKASPEQVGVLTSGANLFLLAGGAIGPLVLGLIASMASFALGFFALALLTLLATVMLARKIFPHLRTHSIHQSEK
jgi:MFS family permease